jgi:glycosyltransferase 2 family protein
MLKSKRFWIGIAIAALCLYLVLRKLDLADIWAALRQINIWLLVLTVAVYIGGYYIRAIRWHYLLKHIKELKPMELFPYLVMGFMANNILPARAGEVIRAVLAGSKKGISRSSTFATIVIERVFDGLVMIAFFVLGYFSFHLVKISTDENVFVQQFNMNIEAFRKLLAIAAIGGSALFILIFIFCFLLIYKREATTGFFHKITAGIFKKDDNPANKLLDTFIEGFGVLRNMGDLVKVLALSFAAWSIEAGTYYLMTAAMHIKPDVNIFLVFLIMAVANLAIMVPGVPGGVGPFELFGVGVMMLFSYPKEIAVTYVLLIHAMILIPIILLGLIFMFTEKLSFRDILNLKKEEK